jgi:hypothetical protein
MLTFANTTTDFLLYGLTRIPRESKKRYFRSCIQTALNVDPVYVNNTNEIDLSLYKHSILVWSI